MEHSTQGRRGLDYALVAVGTLAILWGFAQAAMTGSLLSVFLGGNLMSMGLIGLFGVVGGALLVAAGVSDARPESQLASRALLAVSVLAVAVAVLVLMVLLVF